MPLSAGQLDRNDPSLPAVVRIQPRAPGLRPNSLNNTPAGHESIPSDVLPAAPAAGDTDSDGASTGLLGGTIPALPREDSPPFVSTPRDGYHDNDGPLTPAAGTPDCRVLDTSPASPPGASVSCEAMSPLPCAVRAAEVFDDDLSDFFSDATSLEVNGASSLSWSFASSEQTGSSSSTDSDSGEFGSPLDPPRRSSNSTEQDRSLSAASSESGLSGTDSEDGRMKVTIQNCVGRGAHAAAYVVTVRNPPSYWQGLPSNQPSGAFPTSDSSPTRSEPAPSSIAAAADDDGADAFGGASLRPRRLTAVMKMPSASGNNAAKALAAARTEADILRTLCHENIVRFYGARRDTGAMFIEHCDHGDLHSLVERHTATTNKSMRRTLRDVHRRMASGDGAAAAVAFSPATQTLDETGTTTLTDDAGATGFPRGRGLPEAHVWTVVVQLAGALRYLHDERGVVHRDVKPRNVLVRADGRVALCDFGVAARGDAAAGGAHAAAPFAGTASYAAPELLDQAAFDGRADVWALGCVAFELMAGGVRAFPGRSIAEVVGRVCGGARAALTPLATGYSGALCRAVEAMLREDPRERPSAAELLDGVIGAGTAAAFARRSLFEPAEIERRPAPVRNPPSIPRGALALARAHHDIACNALHAGAPIVVTGGPAQRRPSQSQTPPTAGTPGTAGSPLLPVTRLADEGSARQPRRRVVVSAAAVAAAARLTPSPVGRRSSATAASVRLTARSATSSPAHSPVHLAAASPRRGVARSFSGSTLLALQPAGEPARSPRVVLAASPVEAS